jgi:hypothetical protein
MSQESPKVTTLEFTADDKPYLLSAEPLHERWIVRCSRHGRQLWEHELEDPTAQLVWKLAQINQPQVFQDYRTGPVERTPEEAATAAATLRQIVAGHIDSLAMLEALSG